MDKSSLKNEKHEEERVEDIDVTRSSIQKRSSKDENGSSLDETVQIDERKLLWKIDLHIIPWLSLLYLLSFLDRGSIGNAKLYNLERDLGITDRQYLNGLTVFFFPYAFIEVSSLGVFPEQLSTSLLCGSASQQRFSATFEAICLSLEHDDHLGSGNGNAFIRLSLRVPKFINIMSLQTCHGVITSYAGLLVVRFLLGITEGGLYAGVVFYISSWYKRSELGVRIAVFFSAASVAGAFSGLLAAAIANMEGIGGKAAWQWIFILEGLATIVIAFASFWAIEDFPISARFLSDEERRFVIERLKNDSKQSAGGENFSMKHIYAAYKDWQTWLCLAIFMGFDGPLYAFALFTPSVINQLGFHATEANLLSVPVYVWACLVTCAVGVLADRTRSRGYINIAFFGIGLAGYIILIASRSPALSYFGVFLAASAIYPVTANSASWVACNLEGSYKRAVALATVIGWGNLNGAVTSNVYRAKDAPWYRLGHGIILGYIAIGFFASIIYHVLLKRENNKRARGERDEVITGIVNPLAREVNGVYQSVEEAKQKKGDKWSGFRYTV
ncbi:hypothetical protein D9619_011500 [Psilocybe cf. subviscida]|uniref:Major facilitator superfamily (MFS) profile domain-containing protein n=1 Tax=Psilocybe cf. subviscida TaxID=2480587 RepID=A0A8H5BT37_9AGAR|nr:hypothetical protein D9619_011500 [Psilocybe cf. subviscida]